jgi:hypothetical protein
MVLDSIAKRVEAMISEFHENKCGLRKLLDKHEVAVSTFYTKLKQYPFLLEAYHAAQESRSDLLVDEIIDISDEEPDPQTARNRIDARKWYASKMKPHKYGEKLDISVLHSVDISGALSDARKRLMPIRSASELPITQRVELIEENRIDRTDTKSVDAEYTPDDIFS